jgi:hypothetical protein
MAHGYLREYDEDFDRGEDRERSDRDWRGRDRQRDRSFMFGEETSGRFRDEDRESRDRGLSGYGPEHGFGGFQGDYSRTGRQEGGFGGEGDWRQGRRSFSSHPDEHYRSWRQKQIDALDRDYADYCREREQQFHQDFDQWRSQRQSNPPPLQTGMTQSGLSQDPSGLTQAQNELDTSPPGETDPLGTATLETSSTRGRR